MGISPRSCGVRTAEHRNASAAGRSSRPTRLPPGTTTLGSFRIRWRRGGKPSASRLSRGLYYLLIGSLLGATFAFAAAATFLVASSAADPTVPDLTGLEVAAAEAVLGGVGLRLAEGQARFDDHVPEGRIVFQEPSPGSFFKRGRSVQVFRSLGPTRRVVPRLEGSTLTEARRQLEAAELTVGRVAEVESDTYLTEARRQRAGSSPSRPVPRGLQRDGARHLGVGTSLRWIGARILRHAGFHRPPLRGYRR